jgi:uncharacterized membrane protein YjgN (DUF898 family)
MESWSNLKTSYEYSEKIVCMDWMSLKKFIIVFVILIFGIMPIAIMAANTATVNKEQVAFGSIREKTPILIAATSIFLIVILLMFLFYYPLRIIIKRDSNGNLIVNKRDLFFSTTHVEINKNQNPKLILKKRRMIGRTVYIIPAYQPIIKYDNYGEEKEINLIFTASYFMRGMGPRGTITKEEAQEISNFLNLELKIEE